ncbi:retrotransposon protein, putative, ty1-copia subclass [Tanacetum coccineum]
MDMKLLKYDLIRSITRFASTNALQGRTHRMAFAGQTVKILIFKSFLKKEKLSYLNFLDWCRNLRIVLIAEDLLTCLEHPMAAALVLANNGQQVPAELLKNLEHFGAYDMLQELKTMFAQQAEHELLEIVKAFHACKQEEGQSVSSYVLKMKSYIDNLERLGHHVSLGLALHESGLLKKDVTPAVLVIKVGKIQKNKGKKPQAAKGKNHSIGKAKLAYAPKANILPPPKKEHPTKDATSHHYHEVGHWRMNYPVYLAELLKKKNKSSGVSTTGIFTIELYSFPNKSWVYETGCGTRICNTTQGLRGSKKLKPGALNIGVISDSHLEDNGFVNYFVKNRRISVSKDNLFYFYAIPCDGIYEIDLHRSNLNDSFIYSICNKRAKLNLDSTLLWHCRLGHIKKKRIQKLQHDGLLKSTDNESFDKCVSCMSGKMARKPFLHKTKRVKDLLGLIHTDVCGPFRTVSRHGAIYFLTFTDHFSHYGYVYLLKHKYEVFEIFKVFQNEVENQLWKTIKALRFDHGGEYISHEFLDHLKECGIVSQHTPPYTPQHNNVSKRRNQTLLDMVRSMMSQKTLPKSFWDCALESVAHILNIVPTIEKTPNEVWHEQTDSLMSQEASESFEDIEEIQDEDTHPSENTSHYHDDDEQEIHELGDHNEPSNYKASLSDPESNKWLEAMNVERKFMKDNQVWDLVDLPPNAKIVGNKWLFKKKIDMDGKTLEKQHTSLESKSKEIDLRELQWTTMKNIMKYLKNTKDMFLINGGDMERELRVTYYTDVGYQIDDDDSKSHTGYVFVLNEGVVDWKSAKQSTIKTPSTEAEYMAASEADKEVVWIRKFIYELDVIPTNKEPIRMYTIVNGPEITKGVKRYRTRVYYLQEVSGLVVCV